MSNETDLDWLARNVHVWPDGKEECLVVQSKNPYPIWSVCKSSCGWIERSEWLARRAELQNKPSWKDAPEWAERLAQDANGSWYFYPDGNRLSSGNQPGMWSHDDEGCGAKFATNGEVLGDWRYTLEKRPKELKPSIEEANRLAREFKPFISIEDNQEQKMKQDNGWFERGEFPPVGFECEMKRIDGRWCKAVTVGKDSGGRMVCELNDNGVFYASTSSSESFRPICAERDVLADLIESHGQMSALIVADSIIAAGFKL